ncbi:VOC family protein [Micromonospora aurantiaca]|uniref:VOC family protein n=1 Tax=Micromonospora aurantiaca (nom. illeg.) TaxID=47850 RepID=UPI0038247B7E
MTAVPFGRLHHLIVDCPDPMAEARFWSAVLGDPITYADDDFTVVSASTAASGLAFQRAPGLTPPTWPDPAVPQQMHLDVMVDDQDAAGEAVLALGARRLPGDHVYADPAGHPFCLIRRPTWASPVGGSA